MPQTRTEQTSFKSIYEMCDVEGSAEVVAKLRTDITFIDKLRKVNKNKTNARKIEDT